MSLCMFMVELESLVAKLAFHPKLEKKEDMERYEAVGSCAHFLFIGSTAPCSTPNIDEL